MDDQLQVTMATCLSTIDPGIPLPKYMPVDDQVIVVIHRVRICKIGAQYLWYQVFHGLYVCSYIVVITSSYMHTVHGFAIIYKVIHECYIHKLSL